MSSHVNAIDHSFILPETQLIYIYIYEAYIYAKRSSKTNQPSQSANQPTEPGQPTDRINQPLNKKATNRIIQKSLNQQTESINTQPMSSKPIKTPAYPKPPTKTIWSFSQPIKTNQKKNNHPLSTNQIGRVTPSRQQSRFRGTNH